MTKRTCTVDGCAKPHRARGLCNTHYGQQNPNKYRQVSIRCAYCGDECTKHAGGSKAYRNRYCGIECRDAHRVSLAPVAPTKPRADRRRPLRRAYEDGDRAGLIDAIKDQSRVGEDGCWIWTKRIDAGYPVAVIAGKHLSAHRLSLEASTGEPLEHKQAHHKCAQSMCVNPDHLQPVEHADNRAEMFKRKWYESRIEELEAALRAVDPMNVSLR